MGRRGDPVGHLLQADEVRLLGGNVRDDLGPRGEVGEGGAVDPRDRSDELRRSVDTRVQGRVQGEPR